MVNQPALIIIDVQKAFKLLYLVSDATATFNRKGPDGVQYYAEEIYNMPHVNLHEEFATIATTSGILEKVRRGQL